MNLNVFIHSILIILPVVRTLLFKRMLRAETFWHAGEILWTRPWPLPPTPRTF